MGNMINVFSSCSSFSFSFFCVWILALKEARFILQFLWLFRQYIQSSLTHAASGTRKSVSRASLLLERFLQVESSKRGFVKVGVA